MFYHSAFQLCPSRNCQYFPCCGLVLGGRSWLHFRSVCPVQQCVRCVEFSSRLCSLASRFPVGQSLAAAISTTLLIKPVSDMWVHILGSGSIFSFSICLDLLICCLICLSKTCSGDEALSLCVQVCSSECFFALKGWIDTNILDCVLQRD